MTTTTTTTDDRIALNGLQTLNNKTTWNESTTSTGQQQQQIKTLPTTTTTTNSFQDKQQIRITGQVELDISYFAKSGSLTVHIMQCTQLAPVSKRKTTSNPYVKLYLLPDKNKSGKRKSCVHRNNLNPKFDEKFTFGPALQLADFDDKILWLSVWHKDRYLSRNDFLGEILLPLSQVKQQLLSSDLCQSTGPIWYSLNERFDPAAYYSTTTTTTMGTMRKKQHLIATKDNVAATTTTTTTTTTIDNSNNKFNLINEQQQQQQIKLVNNNTTTTIKRQTEVSKQQAELFDKLNELQRKAAQLTNAVVTTTTNNSITPSSGGDLSCQNKMNVYLAPKELLFNNYNFNNNQDHNLFSNITGQLFVALKFVPENGQLISANRTLIKNNLINGQLHVIIKEAHNIGGFESPLVLSTATATKVDNEFSSSSSSIKMIDKQQQQQPSLARQLPSGPLPNPFCKCYLLDSNGQRISKQKTPYLKRTSNPRWDFKCIFNSVNLSKLACQAIEIQMFNRDSILVKNNNEPLGGIRLCNSNNNSSSSANSDNNKNSINDDSNSNSNNNNNNFDQQQQQQQEEDNNNEEEALCSERESKLWNQMLVRPNIWVYGELKLRLLRPLIAKTSTATTTTNFD